MKYLLAVAAILCVILLMILKCIADEKRKDAFFREKLSEDYGKLLQKERKPGEMERIVRYHEAHHTAETVDDITWHDLNMDAVFWQMNTALSSAGEEVLYHLLRTPAFKTDTLKKRECIIEYFETHETERIDCQVLLAKLGHTGKYSMTEYMAYLDALESRGYLPHVCAIIAVIFACAMIFVNLPLGLLLLFVVLCFNVVSYFQTKNKIDPYLVCFSYIFRLSDAARHLCKLDMPPLSFLLSKLKETNASLSGFQRGSFLLMSPQRMNGSSNPIDILFDYMRMVFHLDLIQFHHMLSEVRKHRTEIEQMLEAVGEIDAMIAVSSYRHGLSGYCIPKFTDETMLCAEDLYHPLIAHPVPNSIQVRNSVLLTGSNASGKSTFLRTVAINAILAQTIHTVLAKEYEGAMFRIYSSMSLQDDVLTGDSYYMAEIKSIKRILDAAEQDQGPVLCFVDEVLRGTNTVERIAAGVQILKRLSSGHTICFAATHDVELTTLLQDSFLNYHFDETMTDDRIVFDYRLHEGRATSRNAIKLLSLMGYGDQMVEDAEKMARDFLEKGQWSC